MATITIFITESPLQILAGIPSTITLETNVPATVFYTLDGSTPTEGSLVAFGPITMPTNNANVVLKAFATDGVDTSAVITHEYFTNVVPARQPHDKVHIDGNVMSQSNFPFGSPVEAFNVPYIYGNTGGVIVDDQQKPQQSTGFDGSATNTGSGFINPPESKYQFLFSETDAIGQTGKGIGTLPGRVVYVKPTNDNKVVESTNAASPLFDPRALVIFQDSRDTPYDPHVPKINRPYFDLEDPTKARDGALLGATEPITPQGSFLKAHYNPTDNCLIYYYYDNRVGRWIISKEPYYPSQNPTVNMSGIVTRSSRGQGAGMIFLWTPFKYRTLI